MLTELVLIVLKVINHVIHNLLHELCGSIAFPVSTEEVTSLMLISCGHSLLILQEGVSLAFIKVSFILSFKTANLNI